MHEMHEKRGFRSPYLKIEACLGRNLVRNGYFREMSVFEGIEKEFLLREKWKSEFDFALKVFKEVTSRWMEDLSSTKSPQIWICQGVVENLLTAKVPRWIEIFVENLLARHKVSWWIKELLRQSPKSSIDRIWNKIYWEKKSKGLDR